MYLLLQNIVKYLNKCVALSFVGDCISALLAYQGYCLGGGDDDVGEYVSHSDGNDLVLTFMFYLKR